MSKIPLVLDEEEQAQVQIIVQDADADEALRFLKEVIWEQIQGMRRKGMRGHMEQGIQ